VRVLAKLNHPHVIKYLGSFQEGTVLNIVTELAESGSLYDVVKRCNSMGSTLTEAQIWKYFLQTALGLQVLRYVCAYCIQFLGQDVHVPYILRLLLLLQLIPSLTSF